MEKNNIYNKLAKARVMLQKSNLKKSGKNKFANYTYFELNDFLPRVNEIFDELGLFSQFYIDMDNSLGIEMAHLNITNADNISETVEFKSTTAEASIKGATPIQMLGGKHTYMRRYLWLACMEIVENDEQDAQDNTNNTTSYQAKGNSLSSNKKITANQKALIEKVYKGENLDKLLEMNNLKSLDDMSISKATEIISKLKEKVGTNNA